jgi:hypothetical protein
VTDTLPPVKVFITWSGEPSRSIALLLRHWLPVVLQAIKPYMSEIDNDAGVRWNDEVSAELQRSNFGIACLTPTNLDSRWINFESGALSKAVGKARVVPLLHNLSNSDVGPPLSTFMMKQLDGTGILDTLQAMNRSLDPETRLEDRALLDAFDAMWPRLSKSLDDLEHQNPAEPAPRKERELLEEMLQLLRSMGTAPDGKMIYTAPNVLVLAEAMPHLAQIVGDPRSIRVSISSGSISIDVILSEPEVSPEDKLELAGMQRTLAREGIVLRLDWIPF